MQASRDFKKSRLTSKCFQGYKLFNHIQLFLKMGNEPLYRHGKRRRHCLRKSMFIAEIIWQKHLIYCDLMQKVEDYGTVKL